MAKLLTLAMSEMSPKNKQYKVIAYLLDKGEIIGIDLDEKKFKDINGKIVWDIFAVTNVEKITMKAEGLYEINGDMFLERYYSKQEVKNVFLGQMINYSSFKRNTANQYGIIKAKIVLIEKPKYDNDNYFRSYITFWANGEEGQFKYNKDYRWINYWKHICDSGDNLAVDNRIKYYENFFRGREVYLILFRYKHQGKLGTNSSSRKFEYTKDVYWIAGFHYF